MKRAMIGLLICVAVAGMPANAGARGNVHDVEMLRNDWRA
jgi:hypothetical protein